MPLTKLSLSVNELLPNGIVLLTGQIRHYQHLLTTEEKQFIQHSGTHRAREFIAGRSIARAAMQLLGAKPLSIGKDENGCPIWPPSVVGSISHKGGLCGAIAADSSFYMSVGFDIEFTEDLSQTIWETFTSHKEMEQAITCGIEPSSFANILFSSKEAHFKALYPIFGSQTPSLNKIILIVKKHDNHVVTSFHHNNISTYGGLVQSLKASLAWAISTKKV